MEKNITDYSVVKKYSELIEKRQRMNILIFFYVSSMGSTSIADLWHYRQDAVLCVFQTHGQSTTKRTHRAGKSLLAEMTLPGKFTLVVSVLPADQVNFSYQLKYFCSEMK